MPDERTIQDALEGMQFFVENATSETERAERQHFDPNAPFALDLYWTLASEGWQAIAELAQELHQKCADKLTAEQERRIANN